jgi:Flp pilus assembly protein TadD
VSTPSSPPLIHPFAVALLLTVLPPFARPQDNPDPAAAFERAVSEAEASLRGNERELAERRYRSALREGFILLGALDLAEGRLPEAREAFRRASTSPVEIASVSRLTPRQRLPLRRRVSAALARACLNLGIIQAQAERFVGAVELFEKAAELDPDLPELPYSRGVAYFNTRQFEKAAPPLARALAARPGDANLRRMLALAWLNAEAYEKAADLLRDDPRRDADPSLLYAYGLALVRSGRAAEAQTVFGQLLARHGDSAELNVVLGQASAQQGDFESAVRSLQQALRLKADVAEANAALGVIYLKQGRLAEAEEALRAEVKAHPTDLKALHTLATVLDLEGRPEEAVPLLRSVLEAKPDFADARYLLGKVRLAQGAPAEAVEQLEAAARLAPEEANIRYQLGQAYQKLGRTEQAREQFEVFRKLKDKRRGMAP